MNQPTWGLLACVCGFVAASCSGDAEEPVAHEGATPATAVPNLPNDRANESEEDPNPCEQVPAEMVRTALALAPEIEIEARRGTMRATQKLCTYSWPNPDYDAEAEARELMQRMMKQARGGARGTSETIEDGLVDAMSRLGEKFEVSYTYMPPAESPEGARANYDQAFQIMNRGLSRTVMEGVAEGREVSLRFPSVEVQGIGDAAFWSPRIHQLMVLSGRNTVSVTASVSEDEDENLNAAKALAAARMAAL